MYMRNVCLKVLKITSVLCLIVLVIVLASCEEFDESGDIIKGGILLDDAKISEIKSEILSIESYTGPETDDGQNDVLSDEKDNTIEEEWDGEQNLDTENEEQAPKDKMVYWLDNSEKWHLFSDCYHIKNKEYRSGTIEEAKNAGAEEVCKTCKKKSDK